MFMKRVTKLFMLLALIFFPGRSAYALEAMADYTDVPIFMSNVVPPNILILQDSSKDMLGPAYTGSYDSTKTYYGAFTPTLKYSYSGNWYIDAAGTWSGNYLNYVTMRRIDVSLVVMMGGLVTARTGGGNQMIWGYNTATPEDWYWGPATYSGAAGTSTNGTPYHNSTTAGTPGYNTVYAYKAASGNLYVYSCNERSYASTAAMTAAGQTPSAPALNDIGIVTSGGTTTYYKLTTVTGAGYTNLANWTNLGTILEISSCQQTAVTNFAIKVQKLEASEPDSFYNGQTAGVIQQVNTKGRWGLMFFKDGQSDTEGGTGGATSASDGGYIDQNIQDISSDASMNSFINGYQNHVTDNWAPLAETLYTAIGYYKQDASMKYKSTDYTVSAAADPFYYASLGQTVSCGKNFIIIISDGNSTMDTNIPAAKKDYDADTADAAENKVVLTGSFANHSKDITIPSLTTTSGLQLGMLGAGAGMVDAAITTGTTNKITAMDLVTNTVTMSEFSTSAQTIIPITFSAHGTDYLDTVALWGHTADLRADISGTQVVTIYSVYAFGTTIKGKKLMNNAAKNGAFIDSNGNNLPDITSEYSTTGTTFLDTETGSATFNTQIPQADTFYDASEGSDLKTAMMAAITDILKRATSGTAVSVLATSSSGAGNVFQAYFLPAKTILDASGSRDITWIGHLLSLNVDSNGSLRDSVNNCINFSFDLTTNQTMINTVTESSPGVCGTTVSVTTPLTDFVKYNWNAGKTLAAKTAASRKIVTFLDSNLDGKVGAGELIDLTTANAASLQKYMSASTLAEAQNVISWIRGVYDSSTGYRNRTDADGNQWKLGDIIHSTPTVVADPAENYGTLYKDAGYNAFYNAHKNRSDAANAAVYIGANDGMLHAFDVATGSEKWAYVPYNLLPHLRWLKDPNYTHVDYVDLKVKVSDINFGTTAAPDWRTILIGGMRFGGGEISDNSFDVAGDGVATLLYRRSSYFAIDVTDPPDATTGPKVLWEIGHNLSSYGLTGNAMGFTMSYPAIAKVGDNFFAVFGSGPKSSYIPGYQGEVNQTPRVFVVDVKTGTLSASFEVTGDASAFFGDPISVDIDFLTTNPVSSGGTSYNTDVIYIGETYWLSTGGGSWNGRVWRIVTNNDVNPANWKMYNMFNTKTGQPLVAAPASSTDNSKNLWVFFGTGKYLSTTDKTDVASQTMYGIKDPCWNGATGAWNAACGSWGSLNNAASSPSVANTTTALVDVTSAAVTTSSAVSGVAGATSFSALQSLIATKSGWFMNLTLSGERSLNKPAIVGGLLLFTSFVPDSAVCGLGGNSWFYALYYETGTAYYQSVIGTSGTTVLKKSTTSSIGMASSIAVHAGQESGAKAYIQMSTGEATQINFQTAVKIKSGIIAWREL